MSFNFTKMHGLGNDFIVINCLSTPFNLSPQNIAALSRRDTGIGFDQCLVLEPSHIKDIDFFYRIFNASGSEVGQCGNGARCIARFIAHYNLSNKKIIKVATHTTQMTLYLNDDETVSVDMGKPKFTPEEIPFLSPTLTKSYPLRINNHEKIDIFIANIGNPHALIVVPDVMHCDINRLGPIISNHKDFPLETNVEFMQIINQNQIKLRVYERGAKETMACGSGAVAAAAIGILHLGLSNNVKVTLLGGELLVSWPDIHGSIFLQGPAIFVYEGHLMENLCALSS